jgi:signal transduction histidine kinase
MIAAAGHKLSVTVHDGGVCVDGDQIRLTQVFVNLLQNAAKYTPAAGTIAVLVESRDGQGVVHVRDNGAGIPANLLSEIFTAFYQVEMTREQSQGGLGIGLSLCRRLVELHGGAIEALSAGPGMGSEFVVTLPLMADVAASSARNDIHRAQGMASSCAP